jgi:hypothetical protein
MRVPVTVTSTISPTVALASGPGALASPPPAPQDTGTTFEALSASLFEIRAAYEADLRALTTMQRSLERVRCSGTSSGERALLLGEIERLLGQAESTALLLAELRRRAGERVDACRELDRPAVCPPRLLREIA